MSNQTMAPSGERTQSTDAYMAGFSQHEAHIDRNDIKELRAARSEHRPLSSLTEARLAAAGIPSHKIH